MSFYSYQKKWAVLDSFKVKSIACLCMTVDHIVAFSDNDLGKKYYILFRAIGRIAAPLFLFILVQTICHTRSRLNLLKRLYFAGVMVGLSDTIFNLLLKDVVGVYDFGNILFTYFYVAFYIVLIEKTIFAFKENNIYVCMKYAGLGALSLLPCMVYRIIDQTVPAGISIQQRILVKGVRDSLLPAVDRVEYGGGFIVLGILFCKREILASISLFYILFCLHMWRINVDKQSKYICGFILCIIVF